jgi:hypothetical protein
LAAEGLPLAADAFWSLGVMNETDAPDSGRSRNATLAPVPVVVCSVEALEKASQRSLPSSAFAFEGATSGQFLSSLMYRQGSDDSDDVVTDALVASCCNDTIAPELQSFQPKEGSHQNLMEEGGKRLYPLTIPQERDDGGQASHSTLDNRRRKARGDHEVVPAD